MSDEDKGYAKPGSFAGVEAEEAERQQHFDRSMDSLIRAQVSQRLAELFGGQGGSPGGNTPAEPMLFDYNGTRSPMALLAFQGDGAPQLIEEVVEMDLDDVGPAAIVVFKEVYTPENPPPASESETVAARVYNGPQAFNGGWNVMTFVGEYFDTHGLHDGANPTRLTVPAGQGGFYAISVSLRFSSGAATEVASYIRTDGSDQSSDVHSTTRQAYGQTLTYTETLQLSAGDYLEVMGLGGSTDNATVRMWKI